MDGNFKHGMTGPQATKKIIERSPLTKVIGLSGEPELEKPFKENGAFKFILKSSGLKDLDEAVKEALGIS
jgi:DNA-binding NtrC family response regulator